MARNPTYEAILAQMGETHDRKNEDYAGEQNPYANFEGAAHLTGLTPDQVFHTMVAIKMERLRVTMNKDGNPNFESIEDTILDAAVYLSLWLAWRRDHRQVLLVTRQEDMMTLGEAFDQAHAVAEDEQWVIENLYGDEDDYYQIVYDLDEDDYDLGCGDPACCG